MKIAKQINGGRFKMVEVSEKEARDIRRAEHKARRAAENDLVPCEGCNKKTGGNVVRKIPRDHTESSRLVSVPQPPILDLKPRSDIALVTVAVGEMGKLLLEDSGPSMRRYAERVKADFIVLDWEGHPDWKMSAKFAIPRVLDFYERIAYVDADVLLRPKALNLFEACRPDEMGIVDELIFHRLNPKFGREKAYLAFREKMGFKPIAKLPWMFNAGVMVVPKSHKHLLMPPLSPIEKAHCAEQDHTNAMLLDSGLPYRLLDRRCNWQNWTDHGFISAPEEAVLHWSGAGKDRKTRWDQIKEWAQKFPWPEKDDSYLHSTDKRHLNWIAEVLDSGVFTRTLEIGCLKGESSKVFLQALHSGKVKEVHLCDTVITEELKYLINMECRIEDRLTIHNRKSLELLAEYDVFDFVFVDGDHSEENVRLEAEALIKAKVEVVFAHDTSADVAGYSDCSGPMFLKEMFQAAGYYCLEDNKNRKGEGTNRGMFFAARTIELYKIGLAAYKKITL